MVNIDFVWFVSDLIEKRPTPMTSYNHGQWQPRQGVAHGHRREGSPYPTKLAGDGSVGAQPAAQVVLPVQPSC